jgi:hypothetical protein
MGLDRSWVGEIGVAKRTHWLESFDPDVQWATSQCGKWAGMVRLREGEPTCQDCKRIRDVRFTADAREEKL